MVSLTSGTLLRIGFFAGLFSIMVLWELMAPRRDLTMSKRSRWFANLSITFLNPLILHLLFPFLAVDLAVKVDARSWGLLNSIDIPYAVKLVIAVIALDLVIYLQHVMFHALPGLWRLHMMHHADLDYDFTTGLRFHPLEIILSMIIKFSAIVAIGAPPLAVLLFEVLLNGTSMFNHGNVRLPLWLDRMLRFVVVTPDMHRVHHSVIIRETNSNFGFNLPWWDRLFGTYKDQPERGHIAMTIGLAQFRDPRKLTLPWLLVLPLVGDPGRQPINRH